TPFVVTPSAQRTRICATGMRPPCGPLSWVTFAVSAWPLSPITTAPKDSRSSRAAKMDTSRAFWSAAKRFGSVRSANRGRSDGLRTQLERPFLQQFFGGGWGGLFGFLAQLRSPFLERRDPKQCHHEQHRRHDFELVY